MSSSYETTGRTRQKARTRVALTDAARTLLEGGEAPTVEQAAAAAQVARATAYRYFPNQRALLAATLPELTQPSLLGQAPSDDPAERLEVVTDEITRQAVEYESALRTMLRLSLQPDPDDRGDLTFRKGRRIVWIGEALEPLRGRLAQPDLDRLVHAIAATVGIDALVWLTDVARLPHAHAVEIMRWSARALLRAALTERSED